MKELQAISRSVIEGVKLHVVTVHEVANATGPRYPEGCDQDQVVGVVMANSVVVFITSKGALKSQTSQHGLSAIASRTVT